MEIIKLADYKGIKAPKTNLQVAEDDIEAQINMMRFQASKLEDKQAPAEDGDTVVIDFKGFVDGEAFAGGEGKDYPLELGSGSFIPGFEEQLIGTVAGEQKDVVVTFPENYHAENLAGKESVFQCTVHKVQQKKLPEVNDAFAQEVSPCKTVEELKSWIKNQIIQEKANFAIHKLEDFVLEKVTEASEVKIFVEEMEERAEALKKNMEMQLMMQGANLQMYLQHNNQTMEELQEILKANACMQLKRYGIMTEVALRENCEVTEEEVNAEIHNMAMQYQMSDEEVKNRMGEEHLKTLKADLLAKKGLAVMVSLAEEEDE